MTKPKARRQKRRKTTGGKTRRRRGAPISQQSQRSAPQTVDRTQQTLSAEPYRPRDTVTPTSLLDALDRHAMRATESSDYQDRYIKLLRFLRSSALMFGFLLMGCYLLLGTGITAAILAAGLPAWAALSIGAGGSAVGVLAAIVKARGFFTERGMLKKMLELKPGQNAADHPQVGPAEPPSDA